mmetsp:Transcript_15517/g.35494  ORF Transcript_15517/g.35494 Transcript_15517/m.35494 type:complete len:405 (-) Transcript_15517:54-1268(-)
MTGRNWLATPDSEMEEAFNFDGIGSMPMGSLPLKGSYGPYMSSLPSNASTRTGGTNTEFLAGLNSELLGSLGISSEGFFRDEFPRGKLVDEVPTALVPRIEDKPSPIESSQEISSSPAANRLVNELYQETAAAVPKVVLRELANQGILQAIPRESHGRLTSVGSLLHFTNSCRPCSFWAGHLHCTYSVACTYCHFHHAGVEHRRLRPSKQMRVRLQRWQALQRKSAQCEDEGEPLGQEGLNELLGVSLQALLPGFAKKANELETDPTELTPKERLLPIPRDMTHQFSSTQAAEKLLSAHYLHSQQLLRQGAGFMPKTFCHQSGRGVQYPQLQHQHPLLHSDAPKPAPGLPAPLMPARDITKKDDSAALMADGLRHAYARTLNRTETNGEPPRAAGEIQVQRYYL